MSLRETTCVSRSAQHPLVLGGEGSRLLLSEDAPMRVGPTAGREPPNRNGRL